MVNITVNGEVKAGNSSMSRVMINDPVNGNISYVTNASNPELTIEHVFEVNGGQIITLPIRYIRVGAPGEDAGSCKITSITIERENDDTVYTTTFPRETIEYVSEMYDEQYFEYGSDGLIATNTTETGAYAECYFDIDLTSIPSTEQATIKVYGEMKSSRNRNG